MSDSATPWTVAHQAPQSMGLPRQEYWVGFLFQGIFPDPGMELVATTTHALQADSLPLSHQGSPNLFNMFFIHALNFLMNFDFYQSNI